MSVNLYVIFYLFYSKNPTLIQLNIKSGFENSKHISFENFNTKAITHKKRNYVFYYFSLNSQLGHAHKFGKNIPLDWNCIYTFSNKFGTIFEKQKKILFVTSCEMKIKYLNQYKTYNSLISVLYFQRFFYFLKLKIPVFKNKFCFISFIQKETTFL